MHAVHYGLVLPLLLGYINSRLTYLPISLSTNFHKLIDPELIL